MKIAHVPYAFHPDVVGGTEVYVESLARGLERRGIRSLICAPSSVQASYLHNGLQVRRFEAGPGGSDAAYIYGEGDDVAAGAFGTLLDSESPDLVHIHAYTASVSLRLARQVKARGLPLVFTYHTPTVTCQRGTLLRWGHSPCDGVQEVAKCSSCNLQGLGVPKPLARAIGALPPGVGTALEHQGLSGGVWTVLRMSSLVKMRQRAVAQFLACADRIVSPSDWVTQLLVMNQVPRAIIVECPQGVDSTPPPVSRLQPPDGILRIAFFGRLHPSKGIDVLLAAIARVKSANVRLDVYAVPADAGERYAKETLNSAMSDGRVAMMAPVTHEEIVTTMARYDLVAVPSVWFETGPLVVLEAFAAGVPVLASNLGGISERVRHETDGLLLPAGDRAAWERAIEQLARDPAKVRLLKSGVREPPSMDGVCEHMARLYADLASESADENRRRASI